MALHKDNNFFRKTGKILLGVFLVMLLVPTLCSLLLAIPWVQNGVVDMAARFASKKLQTTVSIGHIDVGYAGQIHIDDLYVEDYAADTLFYVGHIRAFIPRLGLTKEGLTFSHAHINRAKLYLREMPNGEMNIKQVVNRMVDPNAPRKGKFRLEMRDASIKDMDFVIERLEHRNPEYGIDYGNMRMSDLAAEVNRLTIDGQVIFADIDAMTVREQSGFKVEDLSGKFYLTNGCIGFEEARLRTAESDIYIPSLAIVGNSWEEYKEYVERVEMELVIKDGRLTTDDLAYFAPRFRSWKTTFSEADLSLSGRVADFTGEVYHIRAGNHTYARVGGSVRGLPEVKTTHFDLHIDDFRTRSDEALQLAHNIARLDFAPSVDELLLRLGTMQASGRFGGDFGHFTSQLGLATAVGRVNARASMRPATQAKGQRRLEASVATTGFEVGRLLDKEPLLGKTNVALSLSGTVGRNHLRTRVDGVVSALELNDHSYDSLLLVGALGREGFMGRLTSKDEALEGHVDGLLDWSDSIPRYDFTAEIPRADLARMNFNRRDSVSLLSTRVVAKASGSSLDDLNGRIQLQNSTYHYNDKKISARSISLLGENSSDSKFVELHSDFADATFRSKTGYRRIFDYLRSSAWKYLPLLGNQENRATFAVQRQAVANDFSVLDVKLHRFTPIADAVWPGLMVADNSSARLQFNPASDQLSLRVASDFVEHKNLLVTKLNLNASNRNDSLTLYTNAQDLYVGLLHLPQFSLTGGSRAGRMELSAGFLDTVRRNSARVGLSSSVVEEQGANGRRIDLRVRPSQLTIGGETWSMISTGILIDTASVDVGQFVMQNEDQLLNIHGVASRHRSDTLRLNLRNFSITPFMGFARNLGYDVTGFTNGRATMCGAFGEAMLSANIRLDSLSSNGFTAPSLRLTSGWDFGRKRAGAALTRLDRADTVLRGYYIPDERRYYARLTVDTLNMGLLGPILEGVVSETKGRGDVDVVLRGEGRAAELSGEVKVTDLSTKVDFTQVEYRIPEAVVEVKNNHFIAQRVPVLDPENNRGLFGIDLDMEHLSNIGYRVTLDPQKMLVLNTTIEDNNLFYGRVFATGEGRITGSKGHVEMDISATTDDHSTFYMPLSEQSNIQTAEFVTFVKPNLIDSTDRVAERRRLYEERYRKKQGASSQMHINLDMNVRDNVEMEMMVAGSPIKARGEGSLSLEIVPQTNTFEMYGDYAITEGSYHFSLENLISKRFILEDGSLIQWTGDPMDARLNIDALYKLKTSIQPLLQGTADMAIDRSVPVECRIHIGERLSNPDISFSVVVPDTDPETQSIITTALSTPESVDMQFLYLLVFNNFMAENNSSTSNLGASASAATGLEFLANQLSRLLSADDYNLVIRYRPKSEVASDEVDFGLSKSILNDRLYVEVEGNYLIDSKQAVNGSMSNFMGEAHVSYLIDRSGALRVKAFTQTIDRFDENQGLQETGVGISYKEDFNNFKDLVRRIKERFTSRKRRQRLAQEAAAAAQTEQTEQTEQPEQSEQPAPTVQSEQPENLE